MTLVLLEHLISQREHVTVRVYFEFYLNVTFSVISLFFRNFSFLYGLILSSSKVLGPKVNESYCSVKFIILE